MTEQVIVTRAQPGNAETCARLVAEGYVPAAHPALEIYPLDETPLDLSGVTDIIFTSANGVTAFSVREARRDLAAWCVGPATASAARSAGFSAVHQSRGNSDDLADLILAAKPSSSACFLHVANADAAGGLVRRLQAAGLAIHFAPLYATRPAPDWLAAAKRALFAPQGAILLVHSGKAAEAVRASLAGQTLKGVILVAMSSRAAAPLRRCGARAILIARTPDEYGLFEALATAVLAL